MAPGPVISRLKKQVMAREAAKATQVVVSFEAREIGEAMETAEARDTAEARNTAEARDTAEARETSAKREGLMLGPWGEGTLGEIKEQIRKKLAKKKIKVIDAFVSLIQREFRNLHPEINSILMRLAANPYSNVELALMYPKHLQKMVSLL